MSFLSKLIEAIFGKQYTQKLKTTKGETVKSKGEQILADYFYSSSIDYKYEQEVKTTPFIGKKISRPDFYLPKYKVYIEYWGLANVQNANTRADYNRSKEWKMAQYQRYHITLISIFPSDLHNIDYNFRGKFKETLGYDLPASNGPRFDVNKYFDKPRPPT